MSFSQAQVCSGGVDTSQVNSQTMESKLCRGLYFAGSFWILTVHAADIICNGHGAAAQWPAKMQQRRRKIDSNFTAETSDHTYKGTARKKIAKTLKKSRKQFYLRNKKAISGLQTQK